MLRGMSAKQFADWGAFYSNEPRDEQRADRHAAMICAMLFNAAELTRSGKTAFRFTAEHFMPMFGQLKRVAKEGSEEKAPSKKPVSAASSNMKMAARMWAAAMNAETKREESKRKRHERRR